MLPIVSRPKSDLYAILGILAFLGACVLGAVIYATRTSPLPDPPPLWIAFAFVGVLFGLPLAVALWLLRHLRIVADARGLEIRSAFKKQFIAWQNIEDYELRASPNTAATSRLSWICADSKWRRLPQLHDNMDALRAAIQTQATSSRAREWQLNVARDDADWPKTYAYRDPSGKWSFALMVALLLFYVVLRFGLLTPATSLGIIRDIWDNLEWWGRLGFAAMPLIGLSIATLLLLPHYTIMRAKKTLGRQIIRADQSALTLIDSDAQTRIAWDEISSYYLEDASGPLTLAQCVVEGAGTRVVFRQEIDNYNELKTLIQARAINAKSTEWLARENADSDILGGETSLWSGGVAGVGRKIYHYRTRTMRAVIALGAAMLLVLVVGSGSSMLRRGWEASDIWVLLLFFLPVAIATALGALTYLRSSIQTDENGIFQRSIWGERALKWDEIEAFNYQGYFYEVKGASATIRYSDVAAYQSLRAEIEARTGLKMCPPSGSQSDE